MKRMEYTLLSFVTGWLCLSQLGAASSDSRKIDGPHSTVTVRVYKSGFLSAFGHNHEIQAPIQSGEMTESNSPSVELRVDARKLHVLDPEVSEGTRAQIQETMQGIQVLDVAHFPEIRFQSTAVEPKGHPAGRGRSGLARRGLFAAHARREERGPSASYRKACAGHEALPYLRQENAGQYLLQAYQELQAALF